MRITRSELLEALRIACKEQAIDLPRNATGYEAAQQAGASTIRIAQIIGCSPAAILRRLNLLHRDGLVIRVGVKHRAYRWWPFNLNSK